MTAPRDPVNSGRAGAGYRKIEARVVARTADAALLEVGGANAWVPRSNLSPATCRQIDDTTGKLLIVAEVAEWKADALGWKAERPAGPGLFDGLAKGAAR